MASTGEPPREVEHQVGRVVAVSISSPPPLAALARSPCFAVEVVVETVGDANFIDGAEHAVIQQLFCLGHCWQIELIVSAHQGHTCCADRLPHLVCLRHRQAERLLAQDVLSCLSSNHDGLGVQVMRQADVHGVELRLEDHLPEVGVRRRAELGSAPAGGLLHHIGHGDHFDRIGIGTVATDMSVHDAAAAQQANLDRVHAAPTG